MAKKLPYYQFEPGPYLTGSIQFCSMAAQGLYANICAIYWQRHCELTKEQLVRKFNHPDLIQELFKEKVLKVKGDKVIIDFLIKQFADINGKKTESSENGKRGARKRWSKKDIATPCCDTAESDSQIIATPSEKNGHPIKNEWHLDKRREEEIREDKISTGKKGASHFNHMLAFVSLSYSDQREDFRKRYSETDYNRFADLLQKLLHDFPEIATKFDHCMNIGDWIKHLQRSGYAVVKNSVEKMLAYSIAPDANMALKIKQFIPEKTDKVLTR